MGLSALAVMLKHSLTHCALLRILHNDQFTTGSEPTGQMSALTLLP
jgi:hypothetical protein